MKEFFFSEDRQDQFIDSLLLREFKQSESKFVNRILEAPNFGPFIRLSHINKDFEKFCATNEVLNDYWNLIWRNFGIILSAKSQIKFPTLPDHNNYDLVRGAYYFRQFQLEEDREGAYSYKALQYLQKSIEFNSIHAMQRYYQYRYALQDLTVEEYQEMAKKCLSILKYYGSFCYLLLSEVYFEFSLFLLKTNQTEEAKHYFQAALKSCKEAQNFLIHSKEHTKVASLGQGLKMSNRARLETPDSLENYMKLIFTTSSSQHKSHEPTSGIVDAKVDVPRYSQ